VAYLAGQPSTSSLSRHSVGYLPENPTFFEYLSAEEYLTFVGKQFGMSAESIATESQRVLRLLDLWGAHRRPMRGYSKGMVQRLGLAQVLLHRPQVCILDEPMSGLDPLGRSLVKEVILELKRQGVCVFFSTHITSDVETVCDRVGIIAQGTLHRVEHVASILAEGVTGYRIRLGSSDGLHLEEVTVPREQISARIEAARVRGLDVLLVEPVRNNLEDFFLSVIKGT
jgi:ABC-2 type transport system ATP-binding protein